MWSCLRRERKTKRSSAQPTAVTPENSPLRAELATYGTIAAPGEVLWNFEKFLVDRAGEVVARFAPDVEPDAAVVTEAIERELARG